MTSKNKILILQIIIPLLLLTILGGININNVYGQPTGVNITSNITDIINPTAASAITTPGGSFTTMVLNGTFQTQRWKAYVGNVTGAIVLQDSTQQKIYDWDFSTISGEVYVSRTNTVEWTGISCATNTDISNEDTYLNINDNATDSINKTFNYTIHKSFYVGTTHILNSTCKSIATYVNGTKQTMDENANFQEVLLNDINNNIVFATIMENSISGYNNNPFDFQLIIPEDETKASPTPYYFYVEIN